MEVIFAIMTTTYAVVKIRPENIQACTGIEPMTSAIPELTSQLGAVHYVGRKQTREVMNN